jgi:hypothetical protein
MVAKPDGDPHLSVHSEWLAHWLPHGDRIAAVACRNVALAHVVVLLVIVGSPSEPSRINFADDGFHDGHSLSRRGGAGFRRRVVGDGKQESLFSGRAFPIVENASGLDADLEFVGFIDAECGADFLENGRVEAGQPLLFLDDFFVGADWDRALD